MTDEEILWSKKKSEEGVKGSPHPNAKNNQEYFESQWNTPYMKAKRERFPKTCDKVEAGEESSYFFNFQYMGIDPYWVTVDGKHERCYRELTGCQMTWRKDGVNSGWSLSFHQKNDDFKKECDRRLGLKLHQGVPKSEPKELYYTLGTNSSFNRLK